MHTLQHQPGNSEVLSHRILSHLTKLPYNKINITFINIQWHSLLVWSVRLNDLWYHIRNKELISNATFSFLMLVCVWNHIFFDMQFIPTDESSEIETKGSFNLTEKVVAWNVFAWNHIGLLLCLLICFHSWIYTNRI